MAKDKAQEVMKALESSQRTQKLADVFDRFYERVGGPQAFADLLYDEFQAAQPGSLTRQRILDVILKTTKALDEQAAAVSDLDGMSEEDLQREFHYILRSQGVSLGQTPNVPIAVGGPVAAPACAAAAPAGQPDAQQPAVGPRGGPPA